MIVSSVLFGSKLDFKFMEKAIPGNHLMKLYQDIADRVQSYQQAK